MISYEKPCVCFAKIRYFFADEDEKHSIESFAKFLEQNAAKTIVHWSMNSPKFGFSPIEKRYKELTSKTINVKPLNERISDIPLLIKYFSKKISESYNIKELEIDENDSYILNHNWHGNVRELRNLIERIAILQPDTKEKISNIVKESLKNEEIRDKIAENSLSVPLKEAREKFEKEYLTIQLKKFNGNISKTANFVGMERSALHRKLKGLGIKEFN